MTERKTKFSTLLAAALVIATGASAEPVCMSSGELEAGLVDWYGERPVEPASGARQLWASEVSGSWSLVEYRGDGRACVLRTGDGWAPAEEPGDQLLAQWSGS